MTTSVESEKRPTLSDWVTSRTDQLSEQYSAKAAGHPPAVSVSTGLRSLDAVGLLEPGILTAVMAHSADGKTALMMQFAKACAQSGSLAQVYPFEDPQAYLADRVIAASIGASAFDLRRLAIPGHVEEIKARLGAAQREIAAWADKISVDCERSSVDSLMRKIRERHVPGQTKMVGVDYAQAMDPSHGASDASMERTVANLAWRLNEYAKHENVAVVLLSQVRREVTDRGRRWFESWRSRTGGREGTTDAVEGFRPLESDMQWSSAVQQRARQVLSVFRPGNWMKSVGFQDWKDDIMEVQLCKGSYGPGRGRVSLRWSGPSCEIKDK